MKARVLVLTGLLALVAGLLGWFFWSRLEWGEQDVWVGYSGEARTNDFYAAQRLLQRMGQRTASIQGFPPRPGKNDVILLPRRQVHLSPGQVQALLRWVERGGLLIAEGLVPEARDGGPSQDLLFEALGARMVARTEQEEVQGLDLKAYDETNRDVTVRIDGRDYLVRLGAWLELQDPGGHAVASARNASGIKLLQYDVGRGRVILCTDLSGLSNGEIATQDNAAFLSALVVDWVPGNQAWIVVREQPPSLFAWLREHAWMPLAALGLLMAASLWHAGARFGPPIPDPAEPRRSLLEHLAACGRYQWAHRRGASLLRATREAALARIHQAHPSWGHLEPSELHERLAEASGLPGERIARALEQDLFPDPKDFTEAIQTLDLIRKHL